MTDFFETLNSLVPWDGKSNFGLEKIKKVLKVLGDPQDKVPSIHVTGTNGKGSTSAMVASGLGAAGFRVGMTISPHLEKINERFVIDGIAVEDEWINIYGNILKEAWERTKVVLSYHEALTALGFLGFANSNLDYMVVEVGLGGRLDATNVISNPAICVITSIGLDHQEILGNTLEEIAAEKGGIIKKGALVITGELDSSSEFVISKKCEQQKANLKSLGKEFSYSNKVKEVALIGSHQQKNAAVAVESLKSLGISKKDIERGLTQVFWPGRLEYVSIKNGKKILLDCAHNSHGMRSLVDFLNESTIEKIHLIYGSLEHKDWRNSLNLLAPFVETFCYFEPDSVKALSQNTIEEYFKKHYSNIPFKSHGREYDKIHNNINEVSDNSLILLTGSIYLIGKLRSLLDIDFKPIWKRASVDSHGE